MCKKKYEAKAIHESIPGIERRKYAIRNYFFCGGKAMVYRRTRLQDPERTVPYLDILTATLSC